MKSAISGWNMVKPFLIPDVRYLLKSISLPTIPISYWCLDVTALGGTGKRAGKDGHDVVKLVEVSSGTKRLYQHK